MTSPFTSMFAPVSLVIVESDVELDSILSGYQLNTTLNNNHAPVAINFADLLAQGWNIDSSEAILHHLNEYRRAFYLQFQRAVPFLLYHQLKPSPDEIDILILSAVDNFSSILPVKEVNNLYTVHTCQNQVRIHHKRVRQELHPIDELLFHYLGSSQNEGKKELTCLVPQDSVGGFNPHRTRNRNVNLIPVNSDTDMSRFSQDMVFLNLLEKTLTRFTDDAIVTWSIA